MSPDYSRAANQAYRCLVRLGITALPVSPLAILKRCRDTVVYTFEEASQLPGLDAEVLERGEADALTFRRFLPGGERQYAVCYRAGGNQARLNFTLAHELGHIVLRHDGDGAVKDAEANQFAMHLLCPRPVIRRLSQRYRPLYAEHIAHLCFTSVSASQAVMRCTPCRIDPALEASLDEQLRPAVEEKPNSGALPTVYWHPVNVELYCR